MASAAAVALAVMAESANCKDTITKEGGTYTKACSLFNCMSTRLSLKHMYVYAFVFGIFVCLRVCLQTFVPKLYVYAFVLETLYNVCLCVCPCVHCRWDQWFGEAFVS